MINLRQNTIKKTELITTPYGKRYGIQDFEAQISQVEYGFEDRLQILLHLEDDVKMIHIMLPSGYSTMDLVMKIHECVALMFNDIPELYHGVYSSEYKHQIGVGLMMKMNMVGNMNHNRALV